MINKESTLEYYEKNAQSFIDNTFDVEVSEMMNGFIKLLPLNGSILDVGCGSGRDTLAFLNKGFKVTAFDASPVLAKLSSEKINYPIIVRTIEEMDWNDQFDGVWAMASLLHLKKEDLIGGIKNCVKALKIQNAGIFFATFKIGQEESYDDKGRFFSYYQQEELHELLQKTNYFDKIMFTQSEDKLGRNQLQWLTVTAYKKPGLNLENEGIDNNSIKKMKIK